MENKKYKLVGIFNQFGKVPSDILLVFKGEDSEYYYGYSDGKSWDDNRPYYTGFERLVVKNPKDIRLLSEINSTIENTQESYRVGDIVACGYETEKNNVYIGRLDNYLDFIKGYLVKVCQNPKTNRSYTLVSTLMDEISYTEEMLKEAVNDKRIEKPKTYTINK